LPGSRRSRAGEPGRHHDPELGAAGIELAQEPAERTPAVLVAIARAKADR
jgi:hypothetical protein